MYQEYLKNYAEYSSAIYSILKVYHTQCWGVTSYM